MEEYNFIRFEYSNFGPSKSVAEGHKEIMLEQAKSGYTYNGFVPAVMGPSGKILAIDLVFSK